MKNNQNKKTKSLLSANKLSSFEKAYFKLAERLSLIIFEKYCHGEIEGEENLRALKGGYIIASNHSSYLDWLSLYFMFKKRFNSKIIFLAKEKLFKNIIWKKIMKAADCIMVTDHGIAISSMRKIINTIKNHGIIGVFPEGTRSHNGELLKAKDGVAKIALLTKAPIVPVGLTGLYETWPRQKLLPTSFAKCKIKIGTPIYPQELKTGTNKCDFDHFTKTIMDGIGQQINKSYIHD